MTTRERAEAVKSAAAEIDAAIVAKGGTTAGGLRNAAAAIAALPSGGEVVPLTVTENGLYTPPEGVDGYAPVNVDVPKGQYDGSFLGIGYDTTIGGLSFTFDIPWFYVATPYTVDWGDGTSDILPYRSVASHDYQVHGRYLIKVTNPTDHNWAYNPSQAGSWYQRNPAITDIYFPSRCSIGFYLNNYVTAHLPSGGIHGTNIPRGTTRDYSIKYVGDLVCLDSFNPMYIDSGWTFNLGRVILRNDGSVVQGGGGNSLGKGISEIILEGHTTQLITECAFQDAKTLFRIRNCEKIVGTKPDCKNAFNGCESLIRLPDEIDLSICTQLMNFFGSCKSLTHVPSKMTVNTSLSFASCTGIQDKQSVLDFASNLNTCANDGKTITFNAAIKTLLGDDYTTVEATLNAKNWAVAW